MSGILASSGSGSWTILIVGGAIAASARPVPSARPSGAMALVASRVRREIDRAESARPASGPWVSGAGSVGAAESVI
ncbi:hypothetical protein [Nakamurella aerolata]|uniref:Uncharacterized protein n=1 Tax=Nakamurella aerolata TaxID=1656892 RepID=A0A849A7L3_9ACTN|nr:hypothetical protein [Nakamurella aerolata]NNG35041.1 hypothetical protein [Nakamurella aerolata]